MAEITQQEREQARSGRMMIMPEGAEAQELRKWEQFPTYYTGASGPGNPYRYRPYPKMLYFAKRDESGQIRCMAPVPHPHEFRNALSPADAYRMAEEAANRFTQACQMIVNDESEMQKAMEGGWRESPQEAIEHATQRERAIGTAAAERAYADRNMSDKAKAEAAVAEAAAAPLQLGEIKEASKRQRTF